MEQRRREEVVPEVAAALRRQTPVTREWIANRLAMASASHVSYLLAKSQT